MNAVLGKYFYNYFLCAFKMFAGTLGIQTLLLAVYYAIMYR